MKIEVTITQLKGYQVKIGIDAPKQSRSALERGMARYSTKNMNAGASKTRNHE